MKAIAAFLVKFRFVFLALMVALTVICAMMIPRININTDMTRYLPDDSRMKEGVDSLKAAFPAIDMNAYVVNAMFTNVVDQAQRSEELLSFDGVSGVTSVRESETHTLYALSVKEGADPKAIQKEIEDYYKENVIVETNANSIMPDNMVTILIVGVILVFGILFLMCSSFMEALLFIIAIGLAVIINMGTNALLPSVSMMTNTIVAVLQLVLSMDYSIILMNRYRQELTLTVDTKDAMKKALRSASSSIMSSSLTTIVGLFMLVFMKFKIGLDLGIVLSKGVLCSLISIYTILPALILTFDKAIKKTEKKVFLIPTDGLARFEMRFRIPLAIIFIGIFTFSYILHNRTELSFASIWESRIAEEFHPQNPVMLLYETKDEQKVASIIDSIAKDDKVSVAISYPSIFLKKHRAADMADCIRDLSAMHPSGEDFAIDSSLLSEEMIKLLYYAYTHPERKERMNFADIASLAEEMSSSPLVPESVDVKSLMDKFAGEFITPDIEEEEPQEVLIAEQPIQSPKETAVQIDTAIILKDTVSPAVEIIADSASRFTFENVTLERDSRQMAAFLGFDQKLAGAVFKLSSEETMNARDFVHFVSDKILSRKLYRRMISKKQISELEEVRRQIDSAVLAAPAVTLIAQASTPTQDTAQSATTDTIRTVQKVELPVKVEKEREETPMDVLTQMALSENRYSSRQVSRALNNAGIDIDPQMINLLFLYYGCSHYFDKSIELSLSDMLSFLTGDFLEDETFSSILDDDTRDMLSGLDALASEGLGALRGGHYSMAAIVTDYDIESKETFSFIEKLHSNCHEVFGDNYYLVGESVMYKEMKDGFSRELMFLTLLTVIAIFTIVALTFRSILIPAVTVMTVLSGVYINVFVSGIGGSTMLYLAYLIVQNILMGATIDYGILFTNYYLEKRRTLPVAEALREAYRGSIHTIMTSGLIIICAPYIMSVLLTDPTISSILSSLTFGALAAITLILFVLPAVIACLDKPITRRLKK